MLVIALNQDAFPLSSDFGCFWICLVGPLSSPLLSSPDYLCLEMENIELRNLYSEMIIG